ncbi:hypothetical protein N7462_009533 [Penicillium macrosclerotiorum]|uniref:uncharacterized protein n=1 Tax=Penicillium macrosclerotiorum TaxID=303699 RepID=UPI0025497D6A|nr:uncharacterized protein N7462_009533 [Penicillium macrosclerotiorum]KAJ5674094.1 hypothetical protein N7462_009533 [Penicillium macrosclerotiorum]
MSSKPLLQPLVSEEPSSLKVSLRRPRDNVLRSKMLIYETITYILCPTSYCITYVFVDNAVPPRSAMSNIACLYLGRDYSLACLPRHHRYYYI